MQKTFDDFTTTANLGMECSVITPISRSPISLVKGKVSLFKKKKKVFPVHHFEHKIVKVSGHVGPSFSDWIHSFDNHLSEEEKDFQIYFDSDKALIEDQFKYCDVRTFDLVIIKASKEVGYTTYRSIGTPRTTLSIGPSVSFEEIQRILAIENGIEVRPLSHLEVVHCAVSGPKIRSLYGKAALCVGVSHGNRKHIPEIKVGKRFMFKPKFASLQMVDDTHGLHQVYWMNKKSCVYVASLMS